MIHFTDLLLKILVLVLLLDGKGWVVELGVHFLYGSDGGGGKICVIIQVRARRKEWYSIARFRFSVGSTLPAKF